MELLKKHKDKILYSLIGVLVLALLLSVNTCSNEKAQAASATKYLGSEVTYFKNKLGTETASRRVLEIGNRTLKRDILAKDDSLKALTSKFHKLKSITSIRTVVKIDSIPVPFGVPVPCDFSRVGKYNTEWLSFDYTTTQTGNVFNDFLINNETTAINGFKRKWFLGRQTLTTDVTHSNPFMSTVGVETIEVRIPKPFYDTRAFNIGIGAVGVLLIK